MRTFDQRIVTSREPALGPSAVQTAFERSTEALACCSDGKHTASTGGQDLLGY